MTRGLLAVPLAAFAMAVVSPGAALAAAPDAFTEGATSTSATSAVLAGTVISTGGEPTSAVFQYDLNGSLWCDSGGFVGSPAHTTSSQDVPSDGGRVTQAVSGLTGGADYCFQIVATNASGSSEGGTQIFRAGAPIATTFTGESHSATTETVSGEVNPAGQQTTYRVDWDLASSTWCTDFGQTGSPAHSTGEQQLGYTDATAHQVAVDLTGLTGGLAYCGEIVATNGSTVAHGGVVEFTPGLPGAFIASIDSTGATTATVNGVVNATGQVTTYKVDYGPAASTWCTSFGQSGSPGGSTTPVELPYTDAADHVVAVDLTGLASGSSYCAEMVATNGSGTARSGQSQFTAGTPSVATFYGPSGAGATSETITGTVNPVGQATTYRAEYDLASSEWCTTGGQTGSPANLAAPQDLGATDATPHDVSVTIAGLQSGSHYCAQLTATNASGTGKGGIVMFTAGAPSVLMYAAKSTGPTTVTVTGEINPAEQPTTYRVDYDLASSEWCTSNGNSGSPANSTPPQDLGATDATPHAVSVDLAGLVTGQTYCLALAASNASDTVHGFHETITAGAPIVSPGAATPTGAMSVQVTGTVNPLTQSTMYSFDYDTGDTTWCQSFGNEGSPAHSTTPQDLGATDNTDYVVSADLGGLATGQAYCFRVVATNAAGTSKSYTVDFTAGAPGVQTGQATAVGATSATLNGTVNPAAQATTYHFEWARLDQQFCTSGGDAGSPSASSATQDLGATDASEHAVSAEAAGLTAETDYCYRLVATNATGTTHGSIELLTTTANEPPPPTPPTVTTGAASDVTTTTATLAGTVNPGGSATTYHFEYGTTTSYGSSTPEANAGPGSADQAVTAAISGLSAGTTYHYRLVAANAGGTTNGGDRTLTTAPPPTETSTTTTPSPTTTTTTTTTPSTTSPVVYALPPAAPKCVVPKLKGLTLKKAKRALARAGCKLGKIKKRKRRKGQKKGTVVGQAPAAGARRPLGTKVALVLAR